MKKLSHYVQELNVNNNIVLLNTVTRAQLPVDSSDQILEDNFFLDGQENQALEKRLFSSPQYLNLQVIPTWKCSLRCPSCYVLRTLKPDQHKENYSCSHDDIVSFSKRVYSAYESSIKKIKVTFLGGEANLRPDYCLNVLRSVKEFSESINVKFTSSITTNLYYDLTQEHISLLNEINSVLVSVDGTEETHNKIRFDHNNPQESNTYKKTILNLQRLCEINPTNISVQAGVYPEDFSEQLIADTVYVLKSVGVLTDKITVGLKTSTDKFKVDLESERERFKKPKVYGTPCCAFRHMSNIVISPDGSLSASFHSIETSKIGHVNDNIDKISYNHKQYIRDNMSVLNDNNCLTCPVIGACWGQCVNISPSIGSMPSKYCDRNELIKLVKEKSQDGSITRQIPPCAM